VGALNTMTKVSVESFDRYIMADSSTDTHHDLASRRAKLPKSYHPILDSIPSHLQRRQIKTPMVLDLAMGSGNTSQYLENHNLNVIKTDLSFSALKNISGSRSRCRADELPFCDESFDAIHFKDALVHIEDKEKLFNEFNRILKPRGVLLLATAECPCSNFFYYYKEKDVVQKGNICFENMEEYCNLVNLLSEKQEVISINPPYFKVEFDDIEDSFKKNRLEIISSTTWRRWFNEPDWYDGKMPRMVYFAEKC
jgi:ubiquinone/menaquinone biosynthesis C-methylase UbiE